MSDCKLEAAIDLYGALANRAADERNEARALVAEMLPYVEMVASGYLTAKDKAGAVALLARIKGDANG